MPREKTTEEQAAAEDQTSEAFGASAQPVEDPKPETALETIQRAQLTLDNAIAFARAKADAAVARVESVGGVLSKDMQAAVDKLRATIGD